MKKKIKDVAAFLFFTSMLICVFYYGFFPYVTTLGKFVYGSLFGIADILFATTMLLTWKDPS